MARRRIFEERFAWAWLAAAMAVSAVVILRFGRETTFSIDELVWVMRAPDLSFDTAAHPQAGHLLLTSHLVYKAMLELFGSGYLQFRILGTATLFLTVALFYVYVRRRVGAPAALAASLVLLFFGADPAHVLTGNAFTVLLALSCGLGALLALEREDRLGDTVACALLCLGVVTYSVALAFIVGAALLVTADRRRLQRAWIFLIPALLYGGWWLWARSLPDGPGSQATLSNLLLFPAWSFQSLSAVLSALTGLSYQFSENTTAPAVGPSLAVVALVGLGVRIARGPQSKTFWSIVGVLVALWLLGALTSGGNRFPDTARFMFLGSVVVLLVVAEAARTVKWSRAGIILLYAVAVCGISVNLILLHDAGALLRGGWAVPVKAASSGVELAGSHGKGDFALPELPAGQASLVGTQSPLAFPFSIVRDPADAYRAAASHYGPLGYSLSELRRQTGPVRAQTDSVLVAALGLRLARADADTPRRRCRTLSAKGSQRVLFQLPREGALLEGTSAGGQVALSRFGTSAIPVGHLRAERPAILRVSVDAAPEPWRLSFKGPSVLECPL